DGFGLRDRSWGPRYWQAPAYYRWLTMNFGPDHGLVGALTVQRDGTEMHGGYVFRRDEPNRPIGRVEIETEYAAPEKLHARVRAPRPPRRPAGPRHRDEPPPRVPAAPGGGGRRRASAARALVRGRPRRARRALLRDGLRRGGDARPPSPARRRVRAGARRASR